WRLLRVQAALIPATFYHNRSDFLCEFPQRHLESLMFVPYTGFSPVALNGIEKLDAAAVMNVKLFYLHLLVLKMLQCLRHFVHLFKEPF
ncbi:hypothetical protein MKW98_006790, partial [Papaver atlanticum]